jgi:Cupin-like domain
VPLPKAALIVVSSVVHILPFKDFPMTTHASCDHELIPADWTRWVAENKMQQLPDDRISAILVSNGASPDDALSAVRSVRTDDAIFQAGMRNTQLLRKLESVFNTVRSVASLSPEYGVVPRVDKVSRAEFLLRYYSANRPVIFTQLINHWEAIRSWTPEYLARKCGNVVTEVMTNRGSDPAYEINMESHKTKMLFEDFVKKVFDSESTNDFYMTGNNHFLENPQVQCLLEDIDVSKEYLNPEIPGFSFFWFGPRGTITQPHHDELNILMCQVLGRKAVTLVSPDQTHLLYNRLGVYSDVNWLNPDFGQHPLFRHVHSIDIVLQPGEALFLPVGWWHYIRSLDPSLSISFSNFVFPNEYQYVDPEIRD